LRHRLLGAGRSCGLRLKKRNLGIALSLGCALLLPGALKAQATRQVIFPAADGMAIHGQLFVPEGLAAGERRPAMVFFHGGSQRRRPAWTPRHP
jgi:poly(3-hydroxybutyrate) depolymerase